MIPEAYFFVRCLNSSDNLLNSGFVLEQHLSLSVGCLARPHFGVSAFQRFSISAF